MSSSAIRSVQPQRLGSLSTRVTRSGTGGQGCVLALHSLGLDAHAFDALGDALGDQWQVVSFDQRGHGAAASQAAADLGTYVDDAMAALALCGDRAVHLLGHSMGGAVAALLAERMASRERGCLASLTLVATPAAGHAAFALRGAPALAAGMDAVVPDTLQRWFGDAADTASTRYARSTLQAMQPEGFAAAWQALAGFEGYERIAAHLPATLCIAGADDLSTPPRVMQAIVDAFTRAGHESAASLQTIEHV
ncbi:MAG: hypothetical protein JWQ11_2918, partial [Rhizobacter sp.]|nr:hypothetical protein [Rhizobacter sp.]